ncbi:hypothetical protein SLS56_007703 [Neofusicoccum ribis]|uniref:YDG domain-containing protein n=1 Tax=Neofusicoccum ribis TaxID=45134 RepID=A0ABR3SM88_9PEZI
MAPPDWVHEKRVSPEERKKLARERVINIINKQQQEAKNSSILPTATTPPIKRKRDNSPPELHRYGTASSGSRIAESSRRGSDSTAQSVEATPPRRVQPQWYSSITQKKLSAAGTGRNVDAKLEQIKNLIKYCKERAESEADTTRLFDRIRDELHDLVFLQVTDIALRRKRILHDDTGIPQLFDTSLTNVEFPWDIQADALELYNRWALRVFSVDLLRGIVKRPAAGMSGNRSTDRIDPAYPGKTRADFYGEGNLVNGQWWPTQLCTIRDGAHGSTQGGIYATKGKPAYSIILSGGNHYQDRDEGEELWYSGTDGKDGKFSENTQSLKLNIDASEPVRVIRSHNLTPGASAYRPPRGFRYDGLYEILSYQIVDQAKMACLFHLRRNPRQSPIRFQGKEMRPTAVEVREYDKLRAEIEASERI